MTAPSLRQFRPSLTLISAAIAFSLVVAQSTLGAQSLGSAFSVDDMLDVANVRVADVSDDGRWVAVTSTSLRGRIGIDNSRFGDPTYVAPSLSDLWVIESRNGSQRSVFPEKRQVQDVRWSPDGRLMAVLVRNGDVFQPLVWENSSGRLLPVTVPSGKVVAENTELEWSRDSREVLLALRDEAWVREARSRFESETQGPVAVLSSEEPFLFWEDLRRMPMTRSVVAVDVISGQAREVVPETTLRSYSLADGGREVTYLEDVTQKTDYNVIMGSENQAKSVSIAGGEPRVLIPSTDARALVWSRDNRHYAFRKDSKLYVGSIESSKPRSLVPPDDTASAPGADSAKVQSLTPVRLSRSGDQLVASSKKGLWLINTISGARELFLETQEDDTQAPHYEVMDWSADGASLFLARASRTAWLRGVVRYDLGSRRLQEVLQDARTYSGFQLSEDGSTWVFSASEGNRPNDVFAADLEFQNVRRLTDANRWLKSKQLGQTELISYLDADGKRLHGVVYYPSGYKAGERYPTVFNPDPAIDV